MTELENEKSLVEELNITDEGIASVVPQEVDPEKVREMLVPAIPVPNSLTNIGFTPHKMIAIGEFIPVVREDEFNENNTFIPKNIQLDDINKAILIAVGSEFDKEYKVGDIVVFKMGSQSVMIRGQRYLAFYDYNLIGKY